MLLSDALVIVDNRLALTRSSFLVLIIESTLTRFELLAMGLPLSLISRPRLFFVTKTSMIFIRTRIAQEKKLTQKTRMIPSASTGQSWTQS